MFAAVVVFPTPPFWFATVVVVVMMPSFVWLVGDRRRPMPVGRSGGLSRARCSSGEAKRAGAARSQQRGMRRRIAA